MKAYDIFKLSSSETKRIPLFKFKKYPIFFD